MMFIPGKRALFIPPARTEPIMDTDMSVRGTLYCLPLDVEGRFCLGGEKDKYGNLVCLSICFKLQFIVLYFCEGKKSYVLPKFHCIGSEMQKQRS